MILSKSISRNIIIRVENKDRDDRKNRAGPNILLEFNVEESLLSLTLKEHLV